MDDRRDAGSLAADPAHRGRLVESAVGAHLAAVATEGSLQLHYWRHGNDEVDFVVETPKRLTALEVKSGGPRPGRHRGTASFREMWPEARPLMVGGDGIPLEEFLLNDPLDWV